MPILGVLAGMEWLPFVILTLVVVPIALMFGLRLVVAFLQGMNDAKLAERARGRTSASQTGGAGTMVSKCLNPACGHVEPRTGRFCSHCGQSRGAS